MNRTDISLLDLKAQRQRVNGQIEKAIGRVLEHGRFILGPEVQDLEDRLADLTGARCAVTCGNGTDALVLALMAEGVGPGDAVVVPAFTFAATAEAVALVGATPVFADVVNQSFNIDPASVQKAVEDAKAGGLVPRAVIAVDLFGHPADYDAIGVIAGQYGLTVIADAAQSLGGSRNAKIVGTLADCTTTSFFPSKPLGCYGDGGAIFSDDEDRAALLRSLRAHGSRGTKYENVHIGMNSRLDTLQAAIVIAKLPIFHEEIEARRHLANRYSDALREVVAVPRVAGNGTSAWAQYTLVLPQSTDRDGFRAALQAKGVPTAVYYPKPLNDQMAFAAFKEMSGATPVSDYLSRHVVSLPCHPYLDETTQDYIIDVVAEIVVRT